ncbi:MAG: M20/M25/M40 family metallo-hydrolase [Deltaproteobacteria bacterium]|nr:M20/M25/M40 family metallo-hydrolase [Deltaproteobacteria bacterium]
MLTRWLAPLSVVVLAGIGVLQALAVEPREASPAGAPATEFSAERALEHLRVLAKAPRPVGVPAHEAAREYILGELRRQGLAPEVQAAVWAGTRYGVPFPVAPVRNVVARLPGRASTKPLALVAHYDTVLHAPGAADAGSPVATLLETLRALRAGPPLRNDVLFVFTDAEELGMVGAQAFVAEHPAARELGLALNLEARGVRGPAMMFETSSGNAALVDAFAAAATDPVSSSVFYDVARRLGHGTDFAIFRDAGVPGLNFAFSDGVECYHTPCDDLAHLSSASLQHLGDQALALARRFGNADLHDVRAGDAVWFNTVGGHVVSYGTGWVVPIALFVLASFAAVGVLAWKKRVLRARQTLLGLAAFVGAVVVVPLACWLLWKGMHAVHDGLSLMRAGDPYEPSLYRLGFILAALALSATVFAAARSRLELFDLAAGSALGWLLLLGVTTVVVPSGSHLFAWPLLFQLGALAFLAWRARPEPAAAAEIAVAAAAALPAVLLLAPLVVLLFPALRLPGVPAPAAVIAAAFGLLLPALAPVVSREARWARLLLVLAAAGVLFAAGLNNKFDARRPIPASLAYALDATAGKAWWLSDGPRVDPWAVHFVGEDARPSELPEFLGEPHPARRAPAPAIALAAPSIRLLGDEERDGRRVLRFRVRSERGAPIVRVILPAETAALGGSVDGRPLPPSLFPATLPADTRWGFSYFGAPATGFEWTLETSPGRPVVVGVVDQSLALPEVVGGKRFERPRDTIPARSWIADTTMVRAEARF